jgi:hypothetical protein
MKIPSGSSLECAFFHCFDLWDDLGEIQGKLEDVLQRPNRKPRLLLVQSAPTSVQQSRCHFSPRQCPRNSFYLCGWIYGIPMKESTRIFFAMP